MAARVSEHPIVGAYDLPGREGSPGFSPVHVIRKRGGRKLVITPDGTTERPRPRVDSALVKALASAPLAAHAGERRVSITELAAAEKIDGSSAACSG